MKLTPKAKATLLFLIFALAYLVSPWDLLPFTFFEDIALVAIALIVWLIVAIIEGR